MTSARHTARFEVIILPEATSHTLVLAKAATWGMRRVWRDGYRYSKAGIVTVDLKPLGGAHSGR